MPTDAETARQSKVRLARACEEFLDAFTSLEADMQLDFGGGVSSSRPTASLSEQLQELFEEARADIELDNQLRDLLKQVTHKLSTRGFVGEQEDVVRDPVD